MVTRTESQGVVSFLLLLLVALEPVCLSVWEVPTRREWTEGSAACPPSSCSYATRRPYVSKFGT